MVFGFIFYCVTMNTLYVLVIFVLKLKCVIPENIQSHIPPPQKGFFLRPCPHPSGNPNEASYISLNFLA